MPQFGLPTMPTLLPLVVPSGNATPRGSIPAVVRDLMLGAPNARLAMIARSVLFRGAGLGTARPRFPARFRSFLTRPRLRAVPGLADPSGRRAAVTGLSPGPDTPVRSKNDPTSETPPAAAPGSTLEVS